MIQLRWRLRYLHRCLLPMIRGRVLPPYLPPVKWQKKHWQYIGDW
jgi:hypothetical protein